MGRKIPAKKHRGVKDPLLQQEKRLESLKGKINAPPKDPDEQPVPRSLMRLFGLEDPNKRNKLKTKNKLKKIPQDTGAGGGGGSAVSRLRRAAGESGRDFSLRISSAVRALHTPADELGYPQDLEVEDTKGQRMAAHRERRAAKRRRRAGGGAGGDGEEPHLTRTQKLALKKKVKKTEVEEARQLAQRELRYEHVPFGAVAHAPPALRRPGGATAQRPGRRDLLLSKLLTAGGVGGAGDADARRRERARLDAVAAYRQLKKTKHKETNIRLNIYVVPVHSDPVPSYPRTCGGLRVRTSDKGLSKFGCSLAGGVSVHTGTSCKTTMIKHHL